MDDADRVILPDARVSETQYPLTADGGIGISTYKRGVFFAFSLPRTKVTLPSYSKGAIYVPNKTYQISIFLLFIF